MARSGRSSRISPAASPARMTGRTCLAWEIAVVTGYARRAEDRRLHSYEVFDYALNGIAGRKA